MGRQVFVREATLRARIRRAYRQKGLAFHWSRPGSQVASYGSWFVTDSRGVVDSAEGRNDSTADVAERLRLVRGFERVR
jgi:hypothetical protein